MKVSLKKAFSLLDGRLSTDVKDLYEMLNYIFSDDLMTHQLYRAIKKVEEVNPKWFIEGKQLIDDIKYQLETNDFQTIIEFIDKHHESTNLDITKIDFKIDFI